MNYLKRDLEAIDGKLLLGKSLTDRQMERLNTLRTIWEQQKYMYDNRTHRVPDRIVSVSQPFVRPIVRGKAGKPVEFGAKLDISVADGWTRLECCSFDAYNEAGNLQAMVTAKLRETAAHVIAMSILVLNLRKIQCALLQVFAALVGAWVAQRKLAFVQ